MTNTCGTFCVCGIYWLALLRLFFLQSAEDVKLMFERLTRDSPYTLEEVQGAIVEPVNAFSTNHLPKNACSFAVRKLPLRHHFESRPLLVCRRRMRSWETALTRGGSLGTQHHHRHLCASETVGWNPEHFVTTGKKVVCVGKNYQKHIVEMAANGFLGEQALWTAEDPK
jgi:hypothetical protein